MPSEWFKHELFAFQLKSPMTSMHVRDLNMESTKDDLSFELFIFIPNLNYKRFESLTYL